LLKEAENRDIKTPIGDNQWGFIYYNKSLGINQSAQNKKSLSYEKLYYFL